MTHMPLDYSLPELCQLADVTPRTVRYYIAQGLLPGPTQSGPAARYTDAHLERLRAIKRLQAAHLPLAEIRTRLRVVPDEELGRLAHPEAQSEPVGDAIQYIQQALGTVRRPTSVADEEEQPVALYRLAPPPASVSAASVSAASTSAAPAPHAADDPEGTPAIRSQWERISLDPDVELHIRRPLTRHHNKRVERLIAIARELLKED